MMRIVFPALILAALGAAACAENPNDPSATRRLMPVESVDVLTLESFPVQYRVRVDGYLPDSCWAFDSLEQRRTGQTFVIEVHMRRTAPDDAVCLQRIEPVQRTVPLGALAAGEYVVDVNEGAVRVTFQAS